MSELVGQHLKIALESETEFTDISTLGLFCMSADFPYPQYKPHNIDPPTADGLVDLSDALGDDAALQNLTGTLNMLVLDASKFDFAAFRTKYLGRRIKVITEDDPTHYRVGRCYISNHDRSILKKRFSIVMDADPYRYDLEESETTLTINQSYQPTLTLVESSIGEGATLEVEIATSTTYGLHVWLNTDVTSELYRADALVRTPITKNTQYTFSCSIENRSLASVCNIYVGTSKTNKTLVEDWSSFNSGSNTYLFLELYGYTQSYTSPTGATTGFDPRFNQIMLVAHSGDCTNPGRKKLYPTVTATAACTLAGEYGTRSLVAGVEQTSFETPLHSGSNSIVAYGSTAGTVSVKWRNGYV